MATPDRRFTPDDKLHHEVEKLVLEIRNLRRPVWTMLTVVAAVLGVGIQWVRSDFAYQKAELARLQTQAKLDSLRSDSAKLEQEHAHQIARVDDARQEFSRLQLQTAEFQSAYDSVAMQLRGLSGVVAHLPPAAQQDAKAVLTRLQATAVVLGELKTVQDSVTNSAAAALASVSQDQHRHHLEAVPLSQYRIGIYHLNGYPDAAQSASSLAAALRSRDIRDVEVRGRSTSYLRRLGVSSHVEIRYGPDERVIADELAALVTSIDPSLRPVLQPVRTRTYRFVSLFLGAPRRAP